MRLLLSVVRVCVAGKVPRRQGPVRPGLLHPGKLPAVQMGKWRRECERSDARPQPDVQRTDRFGRNNQAVLRHRRPESEKLAEVLPRQSWLSALPARHERSRRRERRRLHFEASAVGDVVASGPVGQDQENGEDQRESVGSFCANERRQGIETAGAFASNERQKHESAAYSANSQSDFRRFAFAVLASFPVGNELNRNQVERARPLSESFQVGLFVVEFIISKNKPWSCFSFLRGVFCVFRSTDEGNQLRLVNTMWQLCALTPSYGQKAAQFVDLLGYVSMKLGLSKVVAFSW